MVSDFRVLGLRVSIVFWIYEFRAQGLGFTF